MQLCIFILCTCISVLFSAPVDQSSAEQIARNLFFERNTTLEPIEIQSFDIVSEQDIE